MASAYSGTNVTKYNAGGAGDNIVPDGYIKTVEKVWMDSYTIAFTLTKTTVDIAILQKNKKLVGIALQIETTVSQTSGSLALGFSEDSAFGSIMGQTSIAHNLTVSTISLPAIGQSGFGVLATGFGGPTQLSAFQKVITGTQTTITLQFNNWTMTTGTIKSIVYYT